MNEDGDSAADSVPPAEFANPALPIGQLPQAEGVAWQPLPKRYRLRLQTARGLVVVLVCAVAVGLHWVPDLRDAAWREAWMSAALAGALALFAAAMLAWPVWVVARRGYVVRDKDILYKSGVFWQSVKAVPFNRVQHAVTGSTPLDRRFQLANLTVFTAGGSGGDLRISGLEAETAEWLRAAIVGRLGDATAPEPAPAAADSASPSQGAGSPALDAEQMPDA